LVSDEVGEIEVEEEEEEGEHIQGLLEVQRILSLTGIYLVILVLVDMRLMCLRPKFMNTTRRLHS